MPLPRIKLILLRAVCLYSRYRRSKKSRVSRYMAFASGVSAFQSCINCTLLLRWAVVATSGSTSIIVAECITAPSLRDMPGSLDCSSSQRLEILADSSRMLLLRARKSSVTLMKFLICGIRPPTRSSIWRRVKMPSSAGRAEALTLFQPRLAVDQDGLRIN